MFKKLKVQAVLGVVAGSLAIGAPSVSAETSIVLDGITGFECFPWNDLGHRLFFKEDPENDAPYESLTYTTTDDQFIVAFETKEDSEEKVMFASSLYVLDDDPSCFGDPLIPVPFPFVSCLNLTNVGSDPATDYFTGPTPGLYTDPLRTDSRFIIRGHWSSSTGTFEALDDVPPGLSFTGFLTLTLLDGRDLDDLSNEYLCNPVDEDESDGGDESGGDESKGCSGPYGNFCDYYEYFVQRVEESEGLPDTL